MRSLVILTLLIMSTSASIARADAAATPDDLRLLRAFDLDHPVQFHPLFKDKAQWEKRAADLREQIQVATGLWPMPAKTPINAVIHGKIDRDDYTVEKVFFASYPGHYVSGNLYRPKNKTGKLPGVLCPHGHWLNGRFFEAKDPAVAQQIKLGAEQTENGARYPLQARCAMLARMGCVVFHYDMVGMADSKPLEHRVGFTDAQAELRLQSFMGLQTWNSIRSLDFLASLPDVDPARLAVTGSSGGATQTLLLCAIDPRPLVAFPAVMVGEAMQGGCVCENCSHLRFNTNNTEIASLFAPKALGMTAANDWTRDVEVRGLPEIKSIYALYGAEKFVMAKWFNFDHNYNQVSRELMYNWMNDHLKLGWPSPVTEKPFVPIKPAELAVYDETHPQPADAAAAPALRKTMAELSDAQLSQLSSSPDEYRKVVATALRVMIHDRLPSAGQVTVSHVSGPSSDTDLRIERGTLSRRDCGEEVPYIALVPGGWNGNVVVWAHPDGKASLFNNSKPLPAIQKLLDKKFAVASADLFLTGDFGGAAPKVDPKFAGFTFGYNRSTLANRVHDLLSLIGLVRHWEGTKSAELIGVGKAGPWALLARAAAGDAIDRAAVDIAGFDFDKVQSTDDDMMLSGAVKYGGIWGFVPLCTAGKTLLFNPPATKPSPLVAQTPSVELREKPLDPAEIIDWISSH